jgi:hypothetical protein
LLSLRRSKTIASDSYAIAREFEVEWAGRRGEPKMRRLLEELDAAL